MIMMETGGVAEEANSTINLDKVPKILGTLH